MPTQLTPEEQLKWKSRSVQLMREIDQIRDNAQNERELTTHVMSTLAEATEAELGLLYLRDDDAPPGSAGELQLRTVLDRASVFDASVSDDIRTMAAKAAELPSAAFFDAGLQLKDKRMAYCLASSLRVGKESLGSLLLFNEGHPFDGPEHDLVNDAISQIDSALQHARTLRELRRQKKELETIFRIDRIRDQHQEFQELLDAVLEEICHSIEAETGYIMLFDKSGQQLELRASTDYDLVSVADANHPIQTVTQEAIQSAKMVSRHYAEGAVRSIIGQPLILRNKLIGVLGVINRKGRPAFTRSDLNMLGAIASQIDTAIFESLETQRLRGAFEKSVGPQVMDRLLKTSDRDLLSGERVPITALFSDIRGFTNMGERLEPEVLQAVMNDHLSAMTDLVLQYEGTLDKYIGDCVMCFFNAPERQADHALRAVRLAVAMMEAHHRVIDQWQGQLALPPIGIGLSTGETMVGNFGSVKRLEYTVIGHDVNLAARLCGAAEGDQILISQSTYELVQGAVEATPLPSMHLKGIEGDVRAWDVKGLK